MKKLIAKELDSELLLYDPELDTVHVLNATASLVYRLCREGRRPEEIEQEMRRSFGVERSRDILAGIEECIAELQEKGLVERISSDPDCL